MDSELSPLSNSLCITHWENYRSQTLPTDSTDEPSSSDTVMATSSATSTEPNQPAQVTPSEPAPQNLSLVHIIGTKYTDYFTNGTTETSYPGDPTIDANLGKRGA